MIYFMIKKKKYIHKYLNLKFSQELISKKKEIHILLDEKSNQIYKKYNEKKSYL